MHSRPEELSASHKVKTSDWTPQKEIITKLTDWPRSDIERKLTADNAKRAVQAFELLMLEVAKHLPEALSPGILRDAMLMKTTPSSPTPSGSVDA